MNLNYQFQNKEIKDQEMQKVFDHIYEKKIWGGGSGSGSKFTADNKYFLQVVKDYLKKHSLKTICDIGCGDFNILKHFDYDGYTYTGIDIVKSVIDFNKKNYEKENVKFACINMIENIPKGFDFIIIKDVLQHHKDELIENFLPKIIENNKYVLLVNGYKFMRIREKNNWTKRQLDKRYHYHPLDLKKKPLNKFNIKRYVKSIGHRRAKEYILFHKNKFTFKKL